MTIEWLKIIHRRFATSVNVENIHGKHMPWFIIEGKLLNHLMEIKKQLGLLQFLGTYKEWN